MGKSEFFVSFSMKSKVSESLHQTEQYISQEKK